MTPFNKYPLAVLQTKELSWKYTHTTSKYRHRGLYIYTSKNCKNRVTTVEQTNKKLTKQEKAKQFVWELPWTETFEVWIYMYTIHTDHQTKKKHIFFSVLIY